MNDINPILEVQGLGGARLLLFQDSLRIEGKGWRAFLFQGTTSNIDIKLSSIYGIHIKK